MTDPNASFTGSIPVNYQRYLSSVFFNDFADDLAARVDVRPGVRVLEVACGTGFLTERLAWSLAGHADIMNRRPDALPDIKAAMAKNVASELGDRVRIPLRAHVFCARKP
jgi:tRNA A58 N-methylase Trm61